MKHDKIELVVVFKKDVELQRAQEILDGAGATYREGMDSARGKIYFYNTGPKFILTFDTDEERDQFDREHQFLMEVHEIYHPDWTKRKD